MKKFDKLALFGGKKIRNKPYKPPQMIDQKEKKAVMRVLDSKELSGFLASPGKKFFGGKKVQELEKIFRHTYKVKHAIAIQSATAGLHAAVASLDLEPGDEVIVTPYSMIATATSIVMHNCIPVFADVDINTYNICPLSIESKITKKTKAIMLVHLFGYPAEMREIMRIAKKHNLKIIEDCAQAPEAYYEGKIVGAFGDLSVFSFNQNKTITTGEGGVVLTNDDELALRCKLIRNHGEVVLDNYKIKKISGIIGYNYRMTEIEATIGVEQYKKLKSLNKWNINLANYLTKKLKKFGNLFYLPANGCDKCKGNCKSRHVYFIYPFKFNSAITGIHRDVFIKALQAEGLPVFGGYVRPLYHEKMYQSLTAYGSRGFPFKSEFNSNKQNYDIGACPNCEELYKNLLITTPICKYPNTKKEIDELIFGIEKVLANLDEIKKKI